MKTKEIKEAVENIVDYECCPLYVRSQDYKSRDALEYLSNLPNQYKEIAYRWINRRVDEYHSPIPGFEGMTAYDMNELMLRN